MPRKPQPWFRFYVEMFGDKKIRRLTPSQRWAWAGILGAARESKEPGALLIAEGVPMTVGDLADYAGVRLADARKALELAENMGMIGLDPDGTVTVTNWNRRQYESDNVTARTTAFKERQKEQANEQRRNVPNADEGTPSSRGRGRAPASENRDSELTSSEGSRTVPAGEVPRIVKTYVDACRDAGVPAPEDSQDRVSRSARKLIGEGFPLDDVLDAARNAAVGGWTDLATQLQRDAARIAPATNGGQSTTNLRVGAALQLAEDLERRAIQ